MVTCAICAIKKLETSLILWQSHIYGRYEEQKAMKTEKQSHKLTKNSPIKIYHLLLALLPLALLTCVDTLLICRDPNTGDPSTCFDYVCSNGIRDPRLESLVPNINRCINCDENYILLNGDCLTNYVCANGTPVEGTTDTAGQTRCASCNLLYRLIGTTDVVGRSCGQVALGEAARIDMAMRFGVGERNPADLAAIDSTLYMIGADTDVLYTLDTTTGVATRMSDAGVSQFGVGEGFPTGLAAIDSTLYMVGQSNDALYTLNIDSADMTDDGMAIQVGILSAGFGMSEGNPRGLAAIDSTLYMVGQSNDALYTLNIDSADMTDDGRAIRVGSTAAGFGMGESFPYGLAAIGSTLYMVGERTDVLYTLSTTTGEATQVGRLPAGFGMGESFPYGLAAIGSTLYMVGNTNGALYALRYQ